MLSLCTGFASAASSTIDGALGEVNITNGGYKMSYLSMNGVVRSQSYTYFNFKSASGAIKEIPAYCINPTTKGVPQSVNPGESIKYIANEAAVTRKSWVSLLTAIRTKVYLNSSWIISSKPITLQKWRSGAT